MQTLEFPGPALPAAQRADAHRGGHPGDPPGQSRNRPVHGRPRAPGAQNFVADASDTVFTLNAGGQDVTVSVYGLGACSAGHGASAGGRRGRARGARILVTLNDGLLTLDTWLPADAWEAEGWQPYEPEAIRLYVRDVTGEPVEGGDLPEQVREWPTDDDPAAFGDEVPCVRRRHALRRRGAARRRDLVRGARRGEPDARCGPMRATTAIERHGRPVLPHEDLPVQSLAGAA